jgi:hypothetical protein
MLRADSATKTPELAKEGEEYSEKIDGRSDRDY